MAQTETPQQQQQQQQQQQKEDITSEVPNHPGHMTKSIKKTKQELAAIANTIVLNPKSMAELKSISMEYDKDTYSETIRFLIAQFRKEESLKQREAEKELFGLELSPEYKQESDA